jgi:hypothetical protein
MRVIVKAKRASHHDDPTLSGLEQQPIVQLRAVLMGAVKSLDHSASPSGSRRQLPFRERPLTLTILIPAWVQTVLAICVDDPGGNTKFEVFCVTTPPTVTIRQEPDESKGAGLLAPPQML